MRRLIIAILLLSLPGGAAAQSTFSSIKQQTGGSGVDVPLPTPGDFGLSSAEIDALLGRLETDAPPSPAVPPIDWGTVLANQSAQKLTEKGAGTSSPKPLPPIDAAMLKVMEAMSAQVTAGMTPVNNAQMAGLLQQAGFSALEAQTAAAALTSGAAGAEAAKSAMRDAVMQKMAAMAAAKAGVPSAPAPTSVLVEQMKAAVDLKIQNAIAEAAAAAAAAAVQRAAQQVAEIERSKAEAQAGLLQAAAQKLANSTTEKTYSKPSPGAVWPAWIGGSPRYADIANNNLSTGMSGFLAMYMGEARGTDGLGNDVVGDFSIFFDAMPGDDVFLEGVLLGLEFDARLTKPTANGFSAAIYGGTTDLTSGRSESYSGGTLAGKFYGADHQLVGGTFSLEGSGAPDLSGHFAGDVP